MCEGGLKVMNSGSLDEWSNKELKSSHSIYNRLGRLAWRVVYILFFRPSPQFFYAWRRFLLRAFGAQVSSTAVVHSSVKVWAPWNVVLGDYCALGQNVDIYSVGQVVIGDYAVVSQRAFICTASHDYRRLDLPLISKPIVIGAYSWICAEVFVAPGVNIGSKSVILARSVVVSDLEVNGVYSGHPACFVRNRFEE